MAPDRMARTRRDFLWGSLALAGLGLCSSCGGFPPQAQRAAKVPRIGVLSGPPAIFDEPFRVGLRELGYVEGQNILAEWRYDEGRTDLAGHVLLPDRLIKRRPSRRW